MNKFLRLYMNSAHGPLTDVDKRLEDFGFNLYFSFVFTESVKTHQKLQDQYVEALLEQDQWEMTRLNQELLLVESAFEATACMLDATKDHFLD